MGPRDVDEAKEVEESQAEGGWCCRGGSLTLNLIELSVVRVGVPLMKIRLDREGDQLIFCSH